LPYQKLAKKQVFPKPKKTYLGTKNTRINNVSSYEIKPEHTVSAKWTAKKLFQFFY